MCGPEACQGASARLGANTLSSTIRRVRKHQPHAGLARDADAILGQLRTLRRALLRNPYADAAAHGLTGPQVTVMALLVSKGPRDAHRAQSRTEHESQHGIRHRRPPRDAQPRAPHNRCYRPAPNRRSPSPESFDDTCASSNGGTVRKACQGASHSDAPRNGQRSKEGCRCSANSWLLLTRHDRADFASAERARAATPPV